MSEERVHRRLAAIIAADVAGYSRLMGEDEEGTLAAVTALRVGLIEPCIADHHGRLVKTTGDGFLAEFASVLDAVRCALELQSKIEERNTTVPENRRVALRVGVNLGDVMIQDGDVFGNGVNVAARLEGLAEPGSVVVSGSVHEQIKGKIDCRFDDLGLQRMKNIDEPVRAFQTNSRKPSVESEPQSLALSDKPSIAVLPFANLSGDPEQEYFGDGIAEDIITALSRLKWLFVIARNSSFTYKGRNVDVRQVGRELGVRYVLEGSVRKGGNRLRITGQLVSTENGNHIWAEKYDGTLADVFDLQDRITEGVVGAIEPSVRQAEIERSRRKRPNSLGAYDLFLRALPHSWAFSTDGTNKAIEILDEALKIDPNYAAAHGLAAWCHVRRNRFGGSSMADWELAKRHARAVLATGTDDAEALAQAAFVIANFERDYAAALEAIERALAITRNSATVLVFCATACAFSGRFDEAIELAERSLRLSPFDPVRFQADIAIAYSQFFKGRFEEAANAAKRAVQSSPNFVPGFAAMAAAYARLGRKEDARAAVDRALALSPKSRVRDYLGTRRFAPEYNENFAAALRDAGLPE